MADNIAEVRLMERRDTSRFTQVRLRSEVRPSVIAQVNIDDKGSDQRNEGAVAIAGGALAEWLNNQHGDNIDPEAVAQTAQESFREMMSDFRQGMH